jgi:hypothetical protein
MKRAFDVQVGRRSDIDGEVLLPEYGPPSPEHVPASTLDVLDTGEFSCPVEPLTDAFLGDRLFWIIGVREQERRTV